MVRWLKRLRNEYDQMMAMHKRNGLIRVIAADGNPPDRYIVDFRCQGVAKVGANNRPIMRDEHRVELILTRDYPRMRPLIVWKTPIFHPNFGDGGEVCIQDWYPQQTLHELCVVLAEMVQYKNYNTTSPLNMRAAMWAMGYRNQLPIDSRDLFAAGATISSPAAVLTSVYDRSVVAEKWVPILPQPSYNTPQATSAARFCRMCGVEFADDNARFCPHCGTKRGVL